MNKKLKTACILLYIIAGIAVAYGCYVCIERPLTRMFSGKKKQPLPASGVTARLRQILRPA